MSDLKVIDDECRKPAGDISASAGTVMTKPDCPSGPDVQAARGRKAFFPAIRGKCSMAAVGNASVFDEIPAEPQENDAVDHDEEVQDGTDGMEPAKLLSRRGIGRLSLK